MSTNDYHFITRWRLEGAVEEIAHILIDALSLARWWPSVYLEVRELAPGDARGLGKQIDLYTKGWLPYTLRWQFRISEIASNGFTLQAKGDFVGAGSGHSSRKAIGRSSRTIGRSRPINRCCAICRS
jgi:hypothetical protein